MDYEREIPLPGDSGKTTDFLVQMIVQLGFRIDHRDAETVRASGPGISNNWQNPILAASTLAWSTAGGRLRLTADFGSLRRFFSKMTYLLLGLAIFLLVLLAGVLHVLPPARIWIVLLPFLPWLFLLPVFRANMLGRARRALDHLLDSLPNVVRS